MNTIDAGAACAALIVTPGELADVARFEAARRLRSVADLLDEGPPSTAGWVQVTALLASAGDWVMRVGAAEDYWEEISGEIDTSGGTETNPHTPADSDAGRLPSRAIKASGTDLAAGVQSNEHNGGQS